MCVDYRPSRGLTFRKTFLSYLLAGFCQVLDPLADAFLIAFKDSTVIFATV